LIAIGIDWDGRRQVLAVELANRESRPSWRDCLLGLNGRRLHGVDFGSVQPRTNFLPVLALDFAPQAAVAGRVKRIGAFRDDVLELAVIATRLIARVLGKVSVGRFECVCETDDLKTVAITRDPKLPLTPVHLVGRNDFVPAHVTSNLIHR